MNCTIFVGLDVHKATVSVAVAEGTRGDEVRSFGTVANRAEAIKKLVGRLARDGYRLSVRRHVKLGSWKFRVVDWRLNST